MPRLSTPNEQNKQHRRDSNLRRNRPSLKRVAPNGNAADRANETVNGSSQELKQKSRAHSLVGQWDSTAYLCGRSRSRRAFSIRMRRVTGRSVVRRHFTRTILTNNFILVILTPA